MSSADRVLDASIEGVVPSCRSCGCRKHVAAVRGGPHEAMPSPWTFGGVCASGIGVIAEVKAPPASAGGGRTASIPTRRIGALIRGRRARNHLAC